MLVATKPPERQNMHAERTVGALMTLLDLLRDIDGIALLVIKATLTSLMDAKTSTSVQVKKGSIHVPMMLVA